MILRWLVAQDLLFWLIAMVAICLVVPTVNYLLGMTPMESLIVIVVIISSYVSLFFDVVRIRSDHE